MTPVSSTVNAAPRDVIGKANRRLAGKSVPAVLYGFGVEPQALSIDRHDFELFMAHHAAGSTLVELQIEGQKGTINAMIRDVQRSAVKGGILHVDFLAVSMDKEVHAVLPIHLVNDPAGVKAGGLLNASLHELNVTAKPGDLPEAIELDVEALEVGESLHVSDVTAPAGVTIIDDPDLIVASVVPPRGPEAEEAALEEGAEPEVVGAEKEEEE